MLTSVSKPNWALFPKPDLDHFSPFQEKNSQFQEKNPISTEIPVAYNQNK
jgi:hypothetical protein